MSYLIEAFKVIFLGIVEGITEWLPISSTGHMLLVDEFIHMNQSEEFKKVFFVVIQLGAILAVVLLFWKKMWPFQRPDKAQGKSILKTDIFVTWLKVVVACIPGTIATLLFGDFIDEHLETPIVIAIMLIFYGAAFIIIEQINKHRTPRVTTLGGITFLDAFLIGLFQVLSIIPGTSRSGATIIGALIIGITRVAAAEFTFFLAVPVMFGLSGLKLIQFGFNFTPLELTILLLGSAVAFLVSLLVVRFLMNYIRRHDFKVFGWYRIILGAVILLYFLVLAR